MLKILNIIKKFFETLGDFLNKRKSLQKKETSIVIKIIKMLREKEIGQFYHMKKFSKIKTNSSNMFFSKKEINDISKN